MVVSSPSSRQLARCDAVGKPTHPPSTHTLHHMGAMAIKPDKFNIMADSGTRHARVVGPPTHEEDVSDVKEAKAIAQDYNPVHHTLSEKPASGTATSGSKDAQVCDRDGDLPSTGLGCLRLNMLVTGSLLYCRSLP